MLHKTGEQLMCRTKSERSKLTKNKKNKTDWFKPKEFKGMLKIDPTPGAILAKNIKNQITIYLKY